MAHIACIVDGERYPSVTEILGSKPSPWLDAWKAKWGVLADRKTAAANRIGTEFHSAVESRINGYPWVIRYARVVKMLDAFLAWAEPLDGRIHETELHVISRLYKYAGTFDAIGTIGPKGDLILFDWKTSSGLKPDMALQLAAYAQAYFEKTGKVVRRGMIVLVLKKKPQHKLIVKEYKLNKRLLNKFLKRLEKFREYNDPVKGAA